jgi:hypothetical protein
MKKRAIIHSFHSEVPETLRSISLDPDLIIALDSHLDVFLPLKSNVDAFPDWIRSAATRATVHAVIRRMFGDFPLMLKAQGLDTSNIPRMLLVTPKSCLNTHIVDNMERMTDLIIGGAVTSEQIGDPSEAVINYLSEELGIEPYPSPPKNLMKLTEIAKSASYPLFDIDIDYFQDMQDECYTPVGNAQPGQLGYSAQALRFIQKIKPEIITISEVKVEAVKRSDSKFSNFITSLKRQGYSITYKLKFKDDEEAKQLIEIYRAFHEGVLKPLQRRQRSTSNGLGAASIIQQQNEEKEAVREYFRQIKR